MERKCSNCSYYNPLEYYNLCKTELFGNIYPEDHGCWAHKYKE